MKTNIAADNWKHDIYRRRALYAENLLIEVVRAVGGGGTSLTSVPGVYGRWIFRRENRMGLSVDLPHLLPQATHQEGMAWIGTVLAYQSAPCLPRAE